jgi:nicotinate-nucleotide adenylyltransferase
MKIGLFFGSFNPVHIGHMVIASYMAEYTDLEQIWMMVSPHNPFKDKLSLLQDYHRLDLVKAAIGDNRKLKASDIEFKLPKPSYTVHTLAHLGEVYPQHQFILIMGRDNLSSLHKWKDYEQILQRHEIYVYPRVNAEKSDLENHASVKFFEAPLMELSSSFIREAIRQEKDVRYMMPENVWLAIEEKSFYRR